MKDLQQTIEYLHKDISTLQQRLQASEDGNGISELRQQVEQLETQLREVITLLRKGLGNSAMKDLQQTIEYLHKDISTLQQRLQASEDGNGISELRQQVEQLETQLREVTAQRDTYADSVNKCLDAMGVLETKLAVYEPPPEPDTLPPADEIPGELVGSETPEES